jgi:spore maturation protein CgeB
LFFGAYDKLRLKFLNALNRADLEIYGDIIWAEKLRKFAPSIQNTYQNKKLYNEELLTKTNSSLATINILREQNMVENSHNMRTFEVPGMGGTLISNYTEEQAYFFEPDEEMLYFSSNDELIEKLDFLKRNPNFSIKIREKALIRSRKSNYSYFYRCKEMIEIINKKLK